MMKLELLKSLVLFIIPIMNMMANHNYLLMMLLNMELLSVSIVMIMLMNMISNSHIEFLSIMVVITAATCEASVLLSTLVLMGRLFNTDSLYAIMSNKC